MKQVRRMYNNHQLLILRIFKDSRNYSYRIYSRRHGVSCGLCGLQRARSSLNKGLAWKICNGQSLLASSHKWMHALTPIVKDDISLAEAARLKVANLIVEDGIIWDIRRLSKYFIPSSVRRIRIVKLPSNFNFLTYSIGL